MGVRQDGRRERFTFAYGLRNPYRMSIDRLTGDIWIGDVADGPGGRYLARAPRAPKA